MSFKEEKPGLFGWLSILQCRRFGIESVWHSENKQWEENFDLIYDQANRAARNRAKSHGKNHTCECAFTPAFSRNPETHQFPSAWSLATASRTSCRAPYRRWWPVSTKTTKSRAGTTTASRREAWIAWSRKSQARQFGTETRDRFSEGAPWLTLSKKHWKTRKGFITWTSIRASYFHVRMGSFWAYTSEFTLSGGKKSPRNSSNKRRMF